MKKPEHSPLPWKLTLDGGLSITAPNMCICLDNMDEAEAHPEINEANFRFVIKAVNSHYELVKALMYLKSYVCEIDDFFNRKHALGIIEGALLTPRKNPNKHKRKCAMPVDDIGKIEVTVNKVYIIPQIVDQESMQFLKAFVDICINGCLLIKGIRLIEGKKGLFISMPSEKAKDDKWYENVRCLSLEVREQITSAVIDAYNETVVNNRQV